MEKSDAQLVAESILEKQGSFVGSFEQLVNRYTSPIYNFSFRLTGNAQTAEDISQETFMKVWKSLEKYDPSQSFRAWIFTIARNSTTDFLRKKKAVPFSLLSKGDDPPFESTISDQEPLPPELAARIENTELLDTLLSKLSPDYQSVLLLHYQEGLTFDEIGHVLGKPLNTVKSQHLRALSQLRTILDQQNYE